MCQFVCFFSWLFYSLTKIRRTKLELRNDCHFRTNRWFTDSTVFTKKCKMLQCDAVMEVTNEKKGSVHFIRITCTKYFNESHFHYNELNVSIECVNNQ